MDQCPQCGFRNNAQDAFCGQCGSPVNIYVDDRTRPIETVTPAPYQPQPYANPGPSYVDSQTRYGPVGRQQSVGANIPIGYPAPPAPSDYPAPPAPSVSPQGMYQPAQQSPSPGRSPKAVVVVILLLGVVVVGALVWGFRGIFGVGNKPPTTVPTVVVTVTQTPTTGNSATNSPGASDEGPGIPADASQAEPGVFHGPYTSASFASNVASALYGITISTGSDFVLYDVYSPVTEKYYSLDCHVYTSYVYCGGGTTNAAQIYITR